MQVTLEITVLMSLTFFMNMVSDMQVSAITDDVLILCTIFLTGK
jgi:hypothetical protein